MKEEVFRQCTVPISGQGDVTLKFTLLASSYTNVQISTRNEEVRWVALEASAWDGQSCTKRGTWTSAVERARASCKWTYKVQFVIFYWKRYRLLRKYVLLHFFTEICSRLQCPKRTYPPPPPYIEKKQYQALNSVEVSWAFNGEK